MSTQEQLPGAPSRLNLRGLLAAAIQSRIARAMLSPVKHVTRKVRAPRRRFGYPTLQREHRAHDGRSIAHYDHEVSAWLASGREGPKPSRRFPLPFSTGERT